MTKLLFKQTLKGIFSQKIQLVALVILTILLSLVVSAVWSSNDRLNAEQKYMNTNSTNFDYTFLNRNGSINLNTSSFFVKDKDYLASYTSDVVAPLYQPLITMGTNPKTSIIDPIIADNYDKYLDYAPPKACDVANSYCKNNKYVTYNIKSKKAFYHFYLRGYKLDFDKGHYFFNYQNQAVKNSVYGQLITNYIKAKNQHNKSVADSYKSGAINLLNYTFGTQYHVWNSTNTNLSDWRLGLMQDKALIHPYFFTAVESVINDINNPTPSNSQVPIKSSEILTVSQLANLIGKYGTSPTYAININNKKDTTIPTNVASITNLIKPNASFDGMFGMPIENVALKNTLNEEGFFYFLNYDIGIPSATIQEFDLGTEFQPMVNQISFSNDTDLASSHNYWFGNTAVDAALKAVGLLTNFNVTIRESFAVDDYNTGKKYRFLNIGDNQNPFIKIPDLKIFEGTAPLDKFDVVITPQIASFMKLKPGDSLPFRTLKFNISGIGGDPWMIYPTINDDDVLPSTHNEYIVYISPPIYNMATDQYFVNHIDRSTLDRTYLNYTGDSDSKKALQNFEHNCPIDSLNLQKYVSQSNIFSQNSKNTNKDNYFPYKVQTANQVSGITRRTKLLRTAQKGYTLIAIVVCLIIGVLNVWAMVLIIRGLIKKNSYEFGVLKANGVKSREIISGFLSYTFAITTICAPVGWALGFLLQMAIVGVFNSLFVLPLDWITVSILPLVVVCGGLYLILGIITVLTGNIFLRNKTLELLTNMFSKAKRSSFFLKLQNKIPVGHFWARLEVSLVVVSSKKLIGLSSTIFVASFIITLALILPVIVNSVSNNLYKHVYAENELTFQQPVYNVPFSKYNIKSWDGVMADESETTNLYARNAYPIYDSNPIPNYIAGNNFDFKKVNFNDMTVSQVLNLFGQDFTFTGGKSISLGWLNALSIADTTHKLSDAIGSLACNVVQSVLNTKVSGGGTWQNCVGQAIENSVPSYVSTMINRNQDTKNRFNINWSNLYYNKKNEELITSFDSALSTLTQPNQQKIPPIVSTYGLNPNTTMFDFKSSQRKDISQTWDQLVANKTIGSTISIPIIVNATFASEYNLQPGQTFDFSPQYKELDYLTQSGTYKPLPRSAWSYDNTGAVSNTQNCTSLEDPAYGNLSPTKLGSEDKTTSFYDFNYSRSNMHYLPDSGTCYGYKNNDDNKVYSWKNIGNFKLTLPSDASKVAQDSLNAVTSGQNAAISYKYQPDKGQKGISNPLGWLTNRPNVWWNLARDNNWLKLTQSIDTTTNATIRSSALANIAQQAQNYGYHINYKVKSIFNAYDTARIYLNQSIANYLLHYDDTIDKDTGQYNWSNGKLSKNPEITDVTTYYSNWQNDGFYTMGGLNQVSSIVPSNGIDSLTMKRHLIDKLINITSAVTSIIITIAIICSVVIIMMIINLFISQFKGVINTLKVQGYSSREINGLTLGVFTPFVIIGLGAGFGIAWLLIRVGFLLMTQQAGFVIPISFVGWLLPVVVGVVAIIYLLSYIVSANVRSRKLTFNNI